MTHADSPRDSELGAAAGGLLEAVAGLLPELGKPAARSRRRTSGPRHNPVATSTERMSAIPPCRWTFMPDRSRAGALGPTRSSARPSAGSSISAEGWAFTTQRGSSVASERAATPLAPITTSHGVSARSSTSTGYRTAQVLITMMESSTTSGRTAKAGPAGGIRSAGGLGATQVAQNIHSGIVGVAMAGDFAQRRQSGSRCLSAP